MIYEITFSPTGGTKKAADILIADFEGNKKEISLLPKNQDYAISFTENDICVIAVPSFGGVVEKTVLTRIKMLKGNGAAAVILCTYGNRAYEDTLIQLKDTVIEAGFVPTAAAAVVSEHSIMRQFATGRPDAQDTAEIAEAGQKIWKKLQSTERFQVAEVPGNRPYKVHAKIPYTPGVYGSCIKCGTCALECPTGAISIEDPAQVDLDTCITCMRCISVCPEKGRMLPQDILAGFAAKMAPVFAGRKKNELFL